MILDMLENKFKDSFNKVFKSITTDNGIEFLDQDSIESSCLVEGQKRTTCYYAHPCSS